MSEDKKPKIAEKALKTEKVLKTNLDNESVSKAKAERWSISEHNVFDTMCESILQKHLR